MNKRWFYQILAPIGLVLMVAGCSDEKKQVVQQAETEHTGGTNQTSENITAKETVMEKFKQLEKEYDARLGVYAIDTGTKETVEFRENERFAYASTFKALAAAVLLKQNPISVLEEIRTFTNEDIITYSPITEDFVNKGMSLGKIAEAAMQYSDNTAGNLLFEELGGPDGFEKALRESGDTITMADRIEPDLNEAIPGESRDTSTPKALATTLEVFGISEYLPADKQEIFTNWLKGNTTGDSLIRAGVPESWEVGDKSGAGGYGTRNDIAIVWPPNREPIIIAIMSSRNEENASFNDKLIAKAAKVIAQAYSNNK
ncbi:class A beta-lactamase [Peribacillus simplex]|uniref:Beta-lactamase n=1 Tax=Peribacillus simplex TaxID=1478 RepID=A0AAW7IKQ4_9BACI|nr:class A beta-lactamase [Peribacillus simplex]AMM94686.1 beta-lactamase [Peribacillus simplex]MDM5293021.1 class A beta-lactamase [Peribacillus simplex]MDM5451896.1 class A beta-lactamase [Peribacillus simplex]